jgi:hypothetical protein
VQRRDAVLRAMKDHPISQRRACVLIGVDPKTVRREQPPDNPEIREEMHTRSPRSVVAAGIGAWASCWSTMA